ncbi:MAG: 30S ribosomal protein S9 [Candidatus Shikimatogenerans sp. Tduv]|uniref:Small ribosomal subunit protein uS9 n=1 Tax=Candidatus Shikimatogenerans sp. Tduv TaxID=3158567 RepID=A0AAU7QSQ1_9FLAO
MNTKYHIVSKRKTTISRIYMRKKKNNNNYLLINKINFKKYFKNNIYILYKINIFFKNIKYNKKNKYIFIVNIKGGGYNSQIESIIYGIAKILYLFNRKKYKILKNNFLLRQDCRKVERKKYGKKKARKSYQFSKR